MKKTFHAYYRLSEGDIASLWKEGLIVPDANVLLNVYRWSESTATELLKLFKALKERLWLPHQVGREFYRNRLSVISEGRKKYDESTLKDFRAVIEALEDKRHPFVSPKLMKRLRAVQSSLKKEFRRNAEELKRLAERDHLLDSITELFDERAGEGFSAEDVEAVAQEGERRYRQRIPPGFQDEKKPEAEKYGDLLLWKQILAKAESAKAGVLLVSDDTKEDWWWRWEGKSLPHPLLREEFMNRVGKPFHMYTSDRFLEEAKRHTGQSVSKEAIQEARTVRTEATLLDTLRRASEINRLLAPSSLAAGGVAAALAQSREAGASLATMIEDSRRTARDLMAMLEEARRPRRDLAAMLEDRRVDLRNSLPALLADLEAVKRLHSFVFEPRPETHGARGGEEAQPETPE